MRSFIKFYIKKNKRVLGIPDPPNLPVPRIECERLSVPFQLDRVESVWPLVPIIEVPREPRMILPDQWFGPGPSPCGGAVGGGFGPSPGGGLTFPTFNEEVPGFDLDPSNIPGLQGVEIRCRIIIPNPD